MGVYYGKTKNDASEQYRFRPHWGSNLEEVFSSVKQAIVNLLQAAEQGDSHTIAKNPLSTMFKGKILYLYKPDQFAPVYSKEHLEYFIAKLNLSGSLRCGADMQRALMEYRATWPDLLAQLPPLYMRLLYHLFGYPANNDSPNTITSSEPMLDKAVEGAEFIARMPPLSVKAKGESENYKKTNFEDRQKHLKRIGDRGEAIVVALEKKRLFLAGKPDLADNIKQISQENDSAGYDILSFDADGTERPIEVKATNSKNLDRGFFVSSNELDKALTLANYHIYFVFSAMSKHPRVLTQKQPSLNDGDFTMRPVTYHVTLSRNDVIDGGIPGNSEDTIHKSN
jgi:hypothetical protein